MNNLINRDTEAVTMTSLELVEFINLQREEGESELRHDHFIAKVPQVLGESGAPNFRDTYRDVQNKERPSYRFPKREACLMAMSYSYDLQAKVFDKMTTLEAQSVHKIPETLPEALRLAAELADGLAKVEAKLALVAPKAEALDLISAGKDTLTMTQVAKVLGVKRKDLMAQLHVDGWAYRQNGSWVAYDAYIKNGCLQFKEAIYTDDKTGQECRKPYCHVTPKGLTKLARMFSIELEAA
ncbi:phage antirepressor protein [Nitrosomonas sp. Is79A3]|uniref:phage antirepressor KilAC domain-containing protein n=1 Tax=Nitrosomonas sp. (strain Is79A3) TaxID=261292 RepID=UPI000215D239